MELRGGDLSKILIFLFIIIVALGGTYLEFRNSKGKREEFQVDEAELNRIKREAIEEGD
ncbi:MAG: hypothetical protein GXO38_05655 [Epsilonproteobacteria bacterium]|nr:hypothetical protein [Campylobacterota bacterium]